VDGVERTEEEVSDVIEEEEGERARWGGSGGVDDIDLRSGSKGEHEGDG
jgi:hypothetical protein